MSDDFNIYLVNVKTSRTIAHIFVVFSEKLNFITCLLYQYGHVSKEKRIMFVHRWRYVSITLNEFYKSIWTLDSSICRYFFIFRLYINTCYDTVLWYLDMMFIFEKIQKIVCFISAEAIYLFSIENLKCLSSSLKVSYCSLNWKMRSGKDFNLFLHMFSCLNR